MGSLPPGLCWQRDTELIPAQFKHPSEPEGRHLLPPAGTVPPRKGPRGERFVQVTTSQADRTHTHTHTHTTECNERSVKPVPRTHSPFVQGSHVTVRPGRGSDGWDMVQESM